MLRDLLVKPTSKRRGPTVDVLSKQSLSCLGTEKEISLAQQPRSPIPPNILSNLQSCVLEAIPGCTLGNQDKAGRSICGVTFNGHYAVLPKGDKEDDSSEDDSS